MQLRLLSSKICKIHFTSSQSKAETARRDSNIETVFRKLSKVCALLFIVNISVSIEKKLKLAVCLTDAPRVDILNRRGVRGLEITNEMAVLYWARYNIWKVKGKYEKAEYCPTKLRSL